MVTPTPPGTMTLPTSSSSTAVPYRSTFRMASMGAWLGETPAALTSMVMSPNCCASAISPRIDARLERSISSGTTSYPASFMILAMVWAFSSFLSPTTIFIPQPIRRAMAMPICPAPVHTITFFIGIFLSLTAGFSVPTPARYRRWHPRRNLGWPTLGLRGLPCRRRRSFSRSRLIRCPRGCRRGG